MDVLYNLVMETSLCICIETENYKEMKSGIFSLESCLFFKENRSKVGTLWMNLDFESKVILGRKFIFNSGEELELSNQEALNISYHSLSGNVHPVIHGYSNWSTIKNFKSSKFFSFMSLITIKYNYMGTNFGEYYKLFKSLGIFKYNGKEEGDLVTQHGRHTVKPHNNIGVLAEHSRFVRFILGTKGIYTLIKKSNKSQSIIICRNFQRRI